MLRFFLEADDAPILVHFYHAKLARCFLSGNLNRADGDVSAGIEMLLEHLGVIHFVDVVAAQNEDMLRTFASDRINVLIHGVGCAAIPLFADAHLRRKNLDEFAETYDGRPACANMTAETERFVLRENKNAAQIRIDAIRKRDVNDAIGRAERNGGFCAIASEGPQTLALTAGEQYDKGIAHIRHGESSGKEAERRGAF